MAPPLSDSDHQLVSSLLALSKQNKKLVHSSVYTAPAEPEITIRSWRLNEHRYYDVPSPFPTLARGLFTTWVSRNPKSEEGDKDGRHRIVARGYEKFFNIGEVPWCTWEALEKHSCPPYVLTLKSNGCIIFIAALTPTKLVVTSKHSLGPVAGSKYSHAQMGEKWLLKQFEAKSKSIEQFAQVLWENNWTAVAELCDDSFEEHVLPYSPEKTGLHLHGINESCGAFRTMSSDLVAAFASEWGFIETPFHTASSIAEVRAFSEEIGRTGQWNGEPIEGFVVRSHASASTPTSRDSPPYPPGTSFFFKVKYDEPYMMYRDWREITKILLSAKAPINDVSIPKSKLRRQESHLYLKWVREEIKKNRDAFKDFNKGKGIIATRERFLQWMNTEHGSAAQAEQRAEALKATKAPAKPKKQFGKTIIVPIAIPGCGKTTVAVALSHLFNFGHVQSDDIQAKKPAPLFIKHVTKELQLHDVVIADKNNHLVQHRQSLRDAVRSMKPPVRLMALYWPTADKPSATVHRICSDRVLERGDNHQTLRPDRDIRHHEQAIWMFLQQTEELSENEVDEIVEMDLEEDLEQSLDRAIDACVRVLGLPKPSQEQIGAALAKAHGYKVTKIVDRQTKRAGKVRYYGIMPEVDLEAVIEKRFKNNDVHPDMRQLWETMIKNKRVTGVPHVTIVHEKGLPAELALWDRCQKLYSKANAPMFSFRLSHLISDDRIMAVSMEDFQVAVDPGEDTSKEAIDFVSSLGPGLKNRLHVTVGTREQKIAPFEARTVVENWKRGKAGKDVHVLPLDNVVVKGRVKGLMN